MNPHQKPAQLFTDMTQLPLTGKTVQHWSQLTLRYGMNPHQKPAQLFTDMTQLPLTGKKVQCWTVTVDTEVWNEFSSETCSTVYRHDTVTTNR